MSVITKCLIDNTSYKKIPKSKRILKPWITPGILRCIQNRNKLQSKLRKDSYNEILKITYIRYRNYCNNLIKKLKRQYERDLLADSVGNSKKLWNNIKSITQCNKSYVDNSALLSIKPNPNESVKYVNNYFANIGKDLACRINSKSNHNKLNKYKSNKTLPQLNSFVLSDTDSHEVEKTLMSLKSESAPG